MTNQGVQPNFPESALEAGLEREWKLLAEKAAPGARAAARCRALASQAPPPAELAALAGRLRAQGPGGPPSEPPQGASGGRLAQWAAGRAALLEARAELIGQGADPAGILSNLTHSEALDRTGGAAAVALAGAGDRVLAVGVDLEPAGRRTMLQLAERVFAGSEPEGYRALPLLEAWVVSEACFKAHPRNRGKVVWQTRVKEFDPAARSGLAHLAGMPEPILFRLVRLGEWRAAVAISRSGPGPGSHSAR